MAALAHHRSTDFSTRQRRVGRRRNLFILRTPRNIRPRQLAGLWSAQTRIAKTVKWSSGMEGCRSYASVQRGILWMKVMVWTAASCQSSTPRKAALIWSRPQRYSQSKHADRRAPGSRQRVENALIVDVAPGTSVIF